MKICQRCVLPATFPGIKFGEGGICNYCAESESEENLEEKKSRFRSKFEELVKEYRGKHEYDGLMSYSGGKDSTYILALLKKDYGMNVLALTVDNGFIPEQTLTNIRTVVETLGIDHIFFKPRFDMLQEIFKQSSLRNIYPPKTLTRASTICTSCMAIVKSLTLRVAIEKSIPFIFFGWSPGQIPIASSIMKNNPEMLKFTQAAVYEPLHDIAGDRINPYFLGNEHFREPARFPYNISPFAFLKYDERTIKATLRKMGWKDPRDVDANSTNCLLNSFANMVHKKRHGFHPYAFELAKLVREGHMKRQDALEKLGKPESAKTRLRVRSKLGLSSVPLRKREAS